MSTLKLAKHRLSGWDMVEVYSDDGKFIGAIYPTDSNAIHIASLHFASVPFVPAESSNGIPVPGFVVRFNPEA